MTRLSSFINVPHLPLLGLMLSFMVPSSKRFNGVKIMLPRSIIALLLIGFCSLCEAQEPVAASDETATMRNLFNGRDLDGWDGDPRLWSVRDGAIRGETTPDKLAAGNTFLVWQGGKPKDFELRLSFRCNATNNSGIQYRSKHFTDNPSNRWIVRGYQHEVRNEVRLPDVAGFIYDEGGQRGRVCLVGEKATWEAEGKKVQEQLIQPDEFAKIFKLDDWNDVRIVAKKNNLKHYLNGRLILDFTDNEPSLSLSEGVLALQLHAGKPMWVEFKNIQLGLLD